MSAIVIPLPFRRGDYAIIDVRYTLGEAREKIEQLRLEGATVVEVGPAVEARS